MHPLYISHSFRVLCRLLRASLRQADQHDLLPRNTRLEQRHSTAGRALQRSRTQLPFASQQGPTAASHCNDRGGSAVLHKLEDPTASH